jgi:hypothetical protein
VHHSKNSALMSRTVRVGRSAMSAQCPVCSKADVDPRIVMSQMCQERTCDLLGHLIGGCSR